MPRKRQTRKGFTASRFILNCIPSAFPEEDWTFQDAVDSGVMSVKAKLPESTDLRESWWKINNQKKTGACVGFATACGVLRWHLVTAARIEKAEVPSARFIWMANKETDEITDYPTTFIEKAGTQTKLALRVARNYGCVLENDLPIDGTLSMMSEAAFYTKAAKLRIASYHNLGRDLDAWRKWLGSQGPILTRLGVDKTWDHATETKGHLKKYQLGTVRGGHAVCLVGYTKDHFIVRNSWGTGWGDRGFAYASNDYAEQAFTEAYGAVL